MITDAENIVKKVAEQIERIDAENEAEFVDSIQKEIDNACKLFCLVV
jgi:ribosomal protein S20